MRGRERCSAYARILLTHRKPQRPLQIDAARGRRKRGTRRAAAAAAAAQTTLGQTNIRPDMIESAARRRWARRTLDQALEPAGDAACAAAGCSELRADQRKERLESASVFTAAGGLSSLPLSASRLQTLQAVRVWAGAHPHSPCSTVVLQKVVRSPVVDRSWPGRPRPRRTRPPPSALGSSPASGDAVAQPSSPSPSAGPPRATALKRKTRFFGASVADTS